MPHITILSKMPVILTKDSGFLKSVIDSKIVPGQIFLLPLDAILVDLPEVNGVAE